MNGQSADLQWQAVQTRSKEADGEFVYAVRTTHIYCRPSCNSRQPKRENVEFFVLPAAAEAVGYRACKRCQPRAAKPVNPRAALVQSICDYLNEHTGNVSKISLEALGQEFNFAPQYLQETFRAVLGITPRQYAEARRLDRFKQQLREGGSVTEAIYEVGYGSPSRVYEKAAGQLGMTPAQYRQQAAGIHITYIVQPTHYGALLIALTDRGVCAVGLYDDAQSAAAALSREYSLAKIEQDQALAPLAQAVIAHIDSGAPLPDLAWDVQATAFQWRVWQALIKIPRGETRTYGEIAHAIGAPTAARAVAAACGSNKLALVIPCHRVIGSSGELRGYKWGIERKRELLASEQK
ncbi:MAG: methylated-DNA--[protein]-cysteine S-methyltransferase [Anaerolineae bacterium]|nr:methylated-DNA--[protein]-cysteine S-methyltransferase [Anaerolineae bacterium]